MSPCLSRFLRRKIGCLRQRHYAYRLPRPQRANGFNLLPVDALCIDLVIATTSQRRTVFNLLPVYALLYRHNCAGHLITAKYVLGDEVVPGEPDSGSEDGGETSDVEDGAGGAAARRFTAAAAFAGMRIAAPGVAAGEGAGAVSATGWPVGDVAGDVDAFCSESELYEMHRLQLFVAAGLTCVTFIFRICIYDGAAAYESVWGGRYGL